MLILNGTVRWSKMDPLGYEIGFSDNYSCEDVKHIGSI